MSYFSAWLSARPQDQPPNYAESGASQVQQQRRRTATTQDSARRPAGAEINPIIASAPPAPQVPRRAATHRTYIRRPPPPYQRDDNVRIVVWVGERKFMTTAQTLKKNCPYFTGYFSGNWESKAQGDGAFFFDHDGDAFEHILSYQRSEIFPVFVAPAHVNSYFDHALYDKVYWLANFLGIEKLRNWIATKGFDPDHIDRNRNDSPGRTAARGGARTTATRAPVRSVGRTKTVDAAKAATSAATHASDTNPGRTIVAGTNAAVTSTASANVDDTNAWQSPVYPTIWMYAYSEDH